MNPLEVANEGDEHFARVLARYSEALSAGDDADPASDPSLSPEMRQRLQRALSCLARLRQFRTRHPVAFASAKASVKSIPAHENSAVKNVGRFRIDGTIGQGGCGIVFLAFDPVLRREVALKVPHLAALLMPVMRRRFLREARAAARLDHPNLVPVYEVGEDNGLCFLVSAYCRGGNLAEWLEARTAPVPARQAAVLLLTLAEATEYVHTHGIYHRDIKPGNILLDIDGENVASESEDRLPFTPRLTDFGLAKQLDDDSGLTSSGMVMGTLNYMAPEQIECRSYDIGPHTDVYGLGAVLYELLTGRPPFTGTSDSETRDQVLFQAPVRPRRLRSGVPRDLEAICLKCLEKLPECRYSNAARLASELRRFLGGEPIEARPSRSVERLGNWLRRLPWTRAFCYFASLVALVLLIGRIWLLTVK